MLNGNSTYSRYEDRLRLGNSDAIFDDLWPSETRGNGNLKKNNVNTGGAQGKGTLLRKLSCRLCGFIFDATAVDHSGGSLDGEGAGGSVATATSTWNTSAPPSITGQVYTASETYGTQAYRKNAGCPLCFTKNGTRLRIIIDKVSPLNTPLALGF